MLKTDIDCFDIDNLVNNLNSEFIELEFLKEQKEKIGNPDNLGTTVMNVVWEQFLNQIAGVAGEDFIAENRGLKLDLRNEAHIQSTENFSQGKIATHNTEINYQDRYNDWIDNFQKNDDGTIKKTYDNRTNTYKETLKTKKNDGIDARAPFDKERPKGTTTMHKDHTISAAEIIRDPAANAHVDKKEQIDFANSDINLMDLDSKANSSKGDSTMNDWLNSERDGKKPGDRFGLNEEELRNRDEVARKEYEKLKKKGEEKSTKSGKESQKKEALKITGKALRTLVMTLFADLIKEIFCKLILWLKSSAKSVATLIEYIKSAIISFVNKLQTHLINAGKSIVTTIAQAIFGPIVSLINKIITLFKQGWSSLKEAINYLKNPINKEKSIEILIAEVGKIIIVGLSGIGAIILSEIIEKSLLSILPILAIEIPLLGSLANLIGLFMSGLTTGLIGAIALNMIDTFLFKYQDNKITKKIINKNNNILHLQEQRNIINEVKLEKNKSNLHNIIKERHQTAAQNIKEVLTNIHKKSEKPVLSGNENEFEEMNELLKGLDIL